MPKTWLYTCLLLAVLNQAQAQQDNGDNKHPELSLEFLEFMSDFGSIDENSFEIIEYHAERDLAQKNAGIDNRGHDNEN